jgi:hypothetical protein
MEHLSEVERRVPQMDLDEALRTTAELEAGENRVVFGRLLSQIDEAQLALFAEPLEAAQSHCESVPRRIAELRERSRGSVAAA